MLFKNEGSVQHMKVQKILNIKIFDFKNLKFNFESEIFNFETNFVFESEIF